MKQLRSQGIILKGEVRSRRLVLLGALALAPLSCSVEESAPGGGGAAGSRAGAGGGSTAGSGGGDAGTGGSTAGTGGGTAGTGGSTASEGGNAGESSLGGQGGDEPGGAGQGGAGDGGQGGEPGGGDVVLFDDDYAPGIAFVAFGGSTNDLSLDASVFHSGTASLKINVPAGGYTGGAFVASAERDLSAHNAVTFWARASADHALNTAGLGNDAAGGAALQVELGAVALGDEWTQVVIPIPSPSVLSAENGLFHFAEGAEDAPYTIWIDDVRYATVDTVGAAQPAIATVTHELTVGSQYTVPGTTVTYPIDGVDRTFAIAPAWFDYASSNEDAATVDGDGVVSGVAAGSAEVTAELEGVPAAGVVTVNVSEPASPEDAAPTPTNDAADVISLFSNAFTNVTVDTWSAGWDAAELADVVVAGNDTKVYTDLSYAGVEFTTSPIDATAMTHLHFDVWLPTATVFKVKLVDFGADGAYGGGDDTEFEVAREGLTTQTWLSLDFALSEFTGLASREHLAQMVLSSNAGATVYFDNVYFFIE